MLYNCLPYTWNYIELQREVFEWADFLIGCNYHRKTEVAQVDSHVGSVVHRGFAVLATTTTAADNHKWHKQCFLTRGEMTSRASKPQISLTDLSLALVGSQYLQEKSLLLYTILEVSSTSSKRPRAVLECVKLP